METILDSSLSHNSSHSGYAGFWLRVVAAIIDGFIFMIPFYAIGFGIGMSDPSDPTALIGAMMFIYIAAFVGQWLYFALMESSDKQATLGKMAMGLKVTNMEGDKLTFAQASGRFFGKILSSLIFSIGYIMAGFTAKKQALHDILANALVVKK